MKYSRVLILSLAAVMLIIAGTAWAGGIKDRMKQRLPAIAALKAKGVVGETNQGYLGFVTGNRSGADVVAAENKDRKAVYSHIAGQQGVSVELVQKRRAKVLADRADPGEYVQNASGAWVKK
ncbi:MAG: YdbL family protein [Desulfobacter sp.]|nr:MAG: YdbL family protein [Desulfobacter sp.]